MNDPYLTTWARQQHAEDGGFAAQLASAHEQVAADLRNLPESLIAASTTQYLFALAGTREERQAAVDAWAARHHVTARQDSAIGYCAKVARGPMFIMAVAMPVREQDGQDADEAAGELVAA